MTLSCLLALTRTDYVKDVTLLLYGHLSSWSQGGAMTTWVALVPNWGSFTPRSGT